MLLMLLLVQSSTRQVAATECRDSSGHTRSILTNALRHLHLSIGVNERHEHDTAYQDALCFALISSFARLCI